MTKRRAQQTGKASNYSLLSQKGRRVVEYKRGSHRTIHLGNIPPPEHDQTRERGERRKAGERQTCPSATALERAALYLVEEG